MSLSHALNTTYLGHYIFVTRILTFILSTLSLSFWAYILSIYNSRIAPTDGLSTLDDSLLTINSLPIVPLTISIFWALYHLLILLRRALRPSGSRWGPTRSQPRPLVHPGWEVGIDGIIWIFMLVMTVLANIELHRWRSGDEYWGVGGHKHVNLTDCPITNPTTGLLEYYCTKNWNNLMKYQIVASSLMGSVVPPHLIVFCRAACDMRRLRKRHRAEQLHLQRPSNPINRSQDTASRPTSSNKVCWTCRAVAPASRG